MAEYKDGMEIIGDFRQLTKDKLGHWDCPPNGEGDLVLTITRCISKTTRQKDGAEKLQPWIYFKETDKPLICNNVNRESIEKLYGARSATNTWYGCKIALYDAPVSQSADGRGIRIRNYIPKETEAVCEECGRSIEAHGSYSVNKIVTMSKAKYGEALCWECSVERSKEAEDE